jgi:hypothetical protein
MTERRKAQAVIVMFPSPYMINNKQLYVQAFNRHGYLGKFVINQSPEAVFLLQLVLP